MKLESLTSGIINLRNSLQPSYKDNISPALFDYDYFTRLESFVKKEREKCKKKLLDLAGEDKDGVLISTPTMNFERKTSAPSQVFSLDLFIDAVLKHYPDVQKHKLRELATTSVVDGSTRKTYTVTQKDDE